MIRAMQETERAGASSHRPARSALHSIIAFNHRAATSLQLKDSEDRMRNPSENADKGFLDGKKSRDAFARLMWAAFPGKSENEVAERASLVLGVTDRQCRNYLRGIHEAKASHVMAVICLLGIEKAMKLIEGKK